MMKKIINQDTKEMLPVTLPDIKNLTTVKPLEELEEWKNVWIEGKIQS